MKHSLWWTTLTLAAVLTWAGTAYAVDPGPKCQAAKNKEAGKYAACRQKAEAKAITSGDPVDYTKCDEKFAVKWQTLEEKAAAKGASCPDEPLDQSALADFIAGKCDDVTTALNGGGLAAYCGDGIQGSGEQCDGSDYDPALTCGGGCLSTCRCRFVDNGNGTVTDNQTRLIWEKKDDGGGIHDKDNSYLWSSSGSNPDGPAFTTFLATLNNAGAGLTCAGGGPTGGCCGGYECADADCFAGKCDWRLPTLTELRSILNCGYSPCINPVFGLTTSSAYWSSSTRWGNPARAMYASFAGGGGGDELKGYGAYYYVRAVRSGE